MSHQACTNDSKFASYWVASCKCTDAIVQTTTVSRYTLCTLLVGFRIGNPKIDLCLRDHVFVNTAGSNSIFMFATAVVLCE